MRSAVRDLLSEFRTDLPDDRLNKRLRAMIGALVRDPCRSLPSALGDVASVEAGYRFLRNKRVSPEMIIAPHREETWRRAAQAETVLSIEDTTEMRFNGMAKRKGLGSLMNDGHGFFLHGALLAALGTHAVPLGLAASETLVRQATRSSRKKGATWKARYAAPDNERLRWHRVAKSVGDEAKRRGVSVIHVADREADEYSLLSRFVEEDQRFVVRVRFDRRLDTDEWASAMLERAKGVVEREVTIAARAKQGDGRRKSKRPRAARSAALTFRAAEVVFARPGHAKTSRPELRLSLVEAIELDPPTGEDPIQWLLATTEPIATTADIERIVDIYRARWLIEEFWKALKTGCGYEERQLESLKTLENALAIFLPIAWHMLLLRSVARTDPSAPAAAVVTPSQLELLTRIARVKNRWGVRLAPNPTAHDVALAIARMGGHLPQNGAPGWLVLRRGLDDLSALQAAAELFGVQGGEL